MTEWKLVPGKDHRIVTNLPNDRCDEASVVSNPGNPANIIATFGNYTGNEWNRWLSVYYSLDGGLSWRASKLPRVGEETAAGASLVSSPLVFGPEGTAYLLALGALLISRDGGKTWKAARAPWVTGAAVGASSPTLLSATFACDLTRAGRLYAAWSTASLGGGQDTHHTRFARSDDTGDNWIVAGKDLGSDTGPIVAWAPELVVAADGTVHVVSFASNGLLNHWRSADGGQTFWTKRVTGQAGVNSRVTACVVGDGRLAVAWAVVRGGVSRIYYRTTDDDGSEWLGPAEGTPLFADQLTSSVHHLRPQLRARGNDVVACAFYELRTENGAQRADLMIAPSTSRGDEFDLPIAISDVSWSSAAGMFDDRSFGKYFGLHADGNSFLVLWPDERTGAPASVGVHPQEIHCFGRQAKRLRFPASVGDSPQFLLRRPLGEQDMMAVTAPCEPSRPHLEVLRFPEPQQYVPFPSTDRDNVQRGGTACLGNDKRQKPSIG